MADRKKAKSTTQVQRHRAIKNQRKRKDGTVEITYHPGVYINEHTTRKHRGQPDECYYICYRHKSKLRWEKVGWASEGYTPALAENIRAERIRAKRHGNDLPVKNRPSPLFKTVAGRYLQWLKDNQKGTVADQNRYDNHLEGPIGNTRLDEIDPAILEKLKKNLFGDGLSPQSVKHVLGLIRRIVNKAIDLKLWGGTNPVRKGSLPRVSNTRLRFLSQAESQALIEACNDHLKPIVVTALSTGMRRGEILSLHWDQVDLEHGFIFLEKTKSGKRREIPISTILKETLAALPRDPEVPWVFYNARTKEPWKEIKRSFASALEAAKIKDFHFHDLRHTFASHLVMNGTPLATVSQLLGHSDISMTMRYAHLAPEHQAAAVDSLMPLFPSGDGSVKMVEAAPPATEELKERKAGKARKGKKKPAKKSPRKTAAKK
ncbi:MAG TPA: site-specific integrase [Syntrophorhabdaceae bacterium]|nr:site-specific integrase [Syntrophorhabdaceae bacterium]